MATMDIYFYRFFDVFVAVAYGGLIEIVLFVVIFKTLLL